MDLRGMVNLLTEALASDPDLLWWVSVSPSSIVQDICETDAPTWIAKYLHVSSLALRAAVSRIKGYGNEDSLADAGQPSVYEVGAWKYTMYNVNQARKRLNDPDYLLFDIWTAICHGRTTIDNVETIIKKASSMSKTGEKLAVGWIGTQDTYSQCVREALERYGFAVYSLDPEDASDDLGYFDTVMLNVIEDCRRSRKNPKPSVTLFSGGDVSMRPGLQDAIIKAIPEEVGVILVSWSYNVDPIYNGLALDVDPGSTPLHIMLLEDIIASNPPPSFLSALSVAFQ